MHPAEHCRCNSMEEHLSKKTKAHKATPNWPIGFHAHQWQEQCLNGNIPEDGKICSDLGGCALDPGRGLIFDRGSHIRP